MMTDSRELPAQQQGQRRQLPLSYCMQELKAYIDSVIAERGREHALSFLSLTQMESVIREALSKSGVAAKVETPPPPDYAAMQPASEPTEEQS